MKKRIYTLLLFCALFLNACADKTKPGSPAPPPPEIDEMELLDHPRLLFTAEDEVKVRALMTTNPTVTGLTNLLRKDADAQLTKAQLPFVKDNRGTILAISREYVLRLITLSMAYRLFDDEKYLKCVDESLNHLCDYPEWGKSHYLDVAEMTTAVSIAYDWLYNDLPQQTKDRVRAAIHTRALTVAENEYKNGNNESWAKRETNWNVVCNGGMTLGALAVSEHYPELAESIVKNATKYIPNCMKHFAPDGVCYEGPGYWEYTNIYLAIFLKAMNDNFGTDYGISELPGVSKSAQFYVRTVSPTGKVFNFADSNGTTTSNSPCFFVFSSLYNQPDVASWYRDKLDDYLQKGGKNSSHFFLSIPWFDETPNSETYQYPLLETYHGINDIIVFRGNDKTEKPISLIAKGADPDMAHQQLDGGTFVVETEGIRWTEDLGVDEYSLPGFWDYAPNGRRWNYFRNTNHAHNTLSIDGKLQYSRGTAHILDEDLESANPSVTLDMTSLYEDQASNVKRKFTLTDNSSIVVNDELTLINPDSELTWSMVTRTNVTIQGNTVIMEKNGKNFYFKIKTPSALSFTAEPAKPNTEGEGSLNGVTVVKCSFKPGTTKTNIIVAMGSDLSKL